MLRNLHKKYFHKNLVLNLFIQRQTFISNEYRCIDAWKQQISSPILSQVKLNDFYNTLDQNFANKGVISAIDVDIFANAITDDNYLDELKDLLNKLRLSAETGNMLDSTHHAVVRNYIQFERLDELIQILKDPLNFGVFLDDYAANILLDKLLISSNYEQAANVASLIMLQEDYRNKITCALCQYACFKYIMTYVKSLKVEVPQEKNKKVEEIKIRIKFLRNPYYDDHFDIKDVYVLAGKTLAWISENSNDNLGSNLQIIGWLTYKKYDKLKLCCDKFAKNSSSKLYPEVIKLLNRECNDVDEKTIDSLNYCISVLNKVPVIEVPLEDSLKILIENAINNTQNSDIMTQEKLFKSWVEIRQEKLDEQLRRLDRAKRMELIERKQKELKAEEQKLWFFENEDKIDLEIEKKDKLVDTTSREKTGSESSDENYVPPEILPKRK